MSDALADALGLTVDEVLAPAVGGPDLDKWVVYVPAENADAVREAMFAAGAGQIGDYSHCSWGVTGTGQFLPHEGASPTIGSVGSVERVAEDRVEMIAPARLRGHVLAAMRSAHPYEEPAFDILALAPVPAGCRARPHRRAADAADVGGVRLSRARRAARHLVGGTRVGRGRCRGVAGRGVRRRGRLAARHRRAAPVWTPT